MEALVKVLRAASVVLLLVTAFTRSQVVAVVLVAVVALTVGIEIGRSQHIKKDGGR